MPDRDTGKGTGEESLLAFLVSCADEIRVPSAGGCPGPNALSALAEGATAPEARAALESHLSRCPECRAAVAAVAGAEGAAESDERPEFAEPRFPRPFGPYALLGRIGGGGMGDVYEAEHAQRGRREALKQLRAGLEDDPRSAERFLREIRAVSAVTHEGIVALHDSGVIDGIAYYTMPLLPGPSLAHLLAGIREAGERPPGRQAERLLDEATFPAAPRPSPEPATNYARRVAAALAGVARGLAALHAAGMVHRDVKPSNLLLDGAGRLVLTDFGLVRIDAQRMTRTGEALGTPAYMAPEQLLPGAAVDARADLYALGATLYEALALRAPHGGASLAETVARVVHGRPRPLRELAPRLPRDFHVVVGRCLERRPADRYPDALALAKDLEACASGAPIAMRPVSPLARAARSVARRRVPLLLLGLAVAAASLYAFTRGGRITVRSVPPARVSLDGESAGSTPLDERAVAAGAHHIELTREGFLPFARAVEVARGATYELDVVLRARDPADPEALRLLAAGRGLERAAVKVESERSPVASAAPVLLLPRGALREPPEELVLWADSPVTETTIRLEREGAAPGAPPLHLWTVANAYRRTAVAVPDEVRSALSAGRYRLAASSGADARFEILGEEERRATAHGLERLRRGFEPDDQAADFLAAEWLLSRGLYGEALAAAARLRQSVGECREVARLVLATLERAGLRDVGPWDEWAAAYLRAER